MKTCEGCCYHYIQERAFKEEGPSEIYLYQMCGYNPGEVVARASADKRNARPPIRCCEYLKERGQK